VRDLDLMSPANRLAPQDRRDLLADLLAMAPGARVETARDGYLSVWLPAPPSPPGGPLVSAPPTLPSMPDSSFDIALRLFYYPYPLVEPLGQQELAVASAVDLGLMKLGAIISRGSRRDFVDLHLLCRELPLAGLLVRAAEKFGHVGDFALQAMKGLADTGAAAGEPMPGLSGRLEWEEVEAWISSEVEAAGRELLPTI
jgi:hypothetical protein